MSDPSASERDMPDKFRRAMRGFAGGVAIVTADHNNEKHAVTLTAAMSLSMDPLSVVIAINANNAIHQALASGADFCLNFLHSGQSEIAAACGGATEREKRFDLARFEHFEGLPYILDAQAMLFCAQDGAHTYGTHTLFIGKVKHIIVSDKAEPLIYADGQYSTTRSAI